MMPLGNDLWWGMIGDETVYQCSPTRPATVAGYASVGAAIDNR